MPKADGKGPMSVNLDKAKNTKSTLKRLMKYLEVHKKALIMVIIFIILYVVCNVASSVMLMPIIDDYIVPMIQNPRRFWFKNNFYKNNGNIYDNCFLYCNIFLYTI